MIVNVLVGVFTGDSLCVRQKIDQKCENAEFRYLRLDAHKYLCLSAREEIDRELHSRREIHRLQLRIRGYAMRPAGADAWAWLKTNAAAAAGECGCMRWWCWCCSLIISSRHLWKQHSWSSQPLTPAGCMGTLTLRVSSLPPLPLSAADTRSGTEKMHLLSAHQTYQNFSSFATFHIWKANIGSRLAHVTRASIMNERNAKIVIITIIPHRENICNTYYYIKS